MAKISAVGYAILLVIAFASVSEFAEGGEEGSLRKEDCPNACDYRCSKADHHRKACLFFCNKCCTTCLCVPSGTYGHKDECPCYRDWKTKKGKSKCP